MMGWQKAKRQSTVDFLCASRILPLCTITAKLIAVPNRETVSSERFERRRLVCFLFSFILCLLVRGVTRTRVNSYLTEKLILFAYSLKAHDQPQ